MRVLSIGISNKGRESLYRWAYALAVITIGAIIIAGLSFKEGCESFKKAEG